MDRVGIGIIGCGHISDAYLIGALKSAYLAVMGVADIRPEAASAKAETHGVAALTIEDLLDHPEIEIVVNLTVPLAHREVSEQILDSGKHVYSEKPLAATFDDARALMETAAAAGKRVGCAPDTFFGAAHQTARWTIDEGRIGRVVGGSVAFLTKGMEDWHPSPDFLFQQGGGPALDAGPYLVTQLVNLLGPVRAVVAIGSRGRDRRMITSQPRHGEYIDVEVDTTVNAILLFESGANVALTTSWDVIDSVRPPIEIYGVEGALRTASPNWFGGEVHLSQGGGAWAPSSRKGSPSGRSTGSLDPGVIVADYRSIGIVDMAVALRQDRRHRASGELALHVLEVLEGVATSVSFGCRVEMTTTCDRPAPVPPGADERVLERG